MISQRRCAQFGLLSACFTLVIMLAILFCGSYEATPGQYRIGTIAKETGRNETSANVKIAAMNK